MRMLWRFVWDLWKRFGRRLARYQTWLFLTVFYVLILSPFALVVKLFSDPLRLKSKAGSSKWILKEQSHSEMKRAREQY